MYEAFFGLHRRPFAATPDPDCCFLTPGLIAELHSLVMCLSEARGVALLVGGSGLGKTLVCGRVVRELAADFVIVSLAHGRFESDTAVLQAVLHALQVDVIGRSATELRLQLESLLPAIHQQSRGLVIVIDDAHQLSRQALEEIRTWPNLATAGQPGPRLMLSGQIELEEHLNDFGLADFVQRVGAHALLEPLTQAESRDLLAFRLEQAGGQLDAMFDPTALQLLLRVADGVPRSLNLLADQALLLAALHERRQVDLDVLQEAIDDVRELPLSWNEQAIQASRRGADAVSLPDDVSTDSDRADVAPDESLQMASESSPAVVFEPLSGHVEDSNSTVELAPAAEMPSKPRRYSVTADMTYADGPEVFSSAAEEITGDAISTFEFGGPTIESPINQSPQSDLLAVEPSPAVSTIETISAEQLLADQRISAFDATWQSVLSRLDAHLPDDLSLPAWELEAVQPAAAATAAEHPPAAADELPCDTVDDGSLHETVLEETTMAQRPALESVFDRYALIDAGQQVPERTAEETPSQLWTGGRPAGGPSPHFLMSRPEAIARPSVVSSRLLGERLSVEAIEHWPIGGEAYPLVVSQRGPDSESLDDDDEPNLPAVGYPLHQLLTPAPVPAASLAGENREDTVIAREVGALAKAADEADRSTAQESASRPIAIPVFAGDDVDDEPLTVEQQLVGEVLDLCAATRQLIDHQTRSPAETGSHEVRIERNESRIHRMDGVRGEIAEALLESIVLPSSQVVVEPLVMSPEPINADELVDHRKELPKTATIAGTDSAASGAGDAGVAETEAAHISKYRSFFSLLRRRSAA